MVLDQCLVMKSLKQHCLVIFEFLKLVSTFYILWMVSNALYLRPQISRELPWVKGLDVNVGMLAARTMALPESESGRGSYGMEFNLGAKYSGLEHVDFMATGALFLPGTYYRNYSDSDYINGFSGVVLGGQLLTRVHF